MAEKTSKELTISLPKGDLVHSHGSPLQASSSLPGEIDRLSAVPFTGMVRDPNTPNSISIDLKNEETRPKRASSIGASIRRLFSKSLGNDERSLRNLFQMKAQEHVGAPGLKILPRLYLPKKLQH